MPRTAQLRDPEALRARYGPWAVVTGASSGIGREMAVTLAGAGCNHLGQCGATRECHQHSQAERPFRSHGPSHTT